MCNERPDEADIPHTEWLCPYCNADNSSLDAYCQFCDTVDVICEKCGAIAQSPLHTLPPGWHQSHGDEFCPDCMAPILDALAALGENKS